MELRSKYNIEFCLLFYSSLCGGQQMLIINELQSFLNYWRLFDDTFCTFLHAHGNDKRVLRQNNLILCHIYVFCKIGIYYFVTI